MFCLSAAGSSCLWAQENQEVIPQTSPVTAVENATAPVPQTVPVVEPQAPPAMPLMTEEMPSTPSVATEEKESASKLQESPSEWMWGEVVSLDEGTKQITIKHLDYETYEEVQTTITIDDKTLFENAKEMKEIKPGDHLTVDYKTRDGLKVASLVVVERGKSKEGLVKTEEEAKGADTSAGVPEEKLPVPASVGTMNETIPAPLQDVIAASSAVASPAEAAARVTPPVLPPSQPPAANETVPAGEVTNSIE